MRELRRNIAFWLIVVLASACARQEPARPEAPSASPRGFSLTETEGGWDLRVIRFYLPSPDTLHFAFRREPGPGDIRWPATRIVCLSATQLGMVAMTGKWDALVGVENRAFVYDSSLLARIDAGLVAEVGASGQLDLERLLALQPDLVFSSGFAGDPGLQRLEELGIPVIPLAEWQESHPLARAAWARVIGMALGQEQLVSAQLQAGQQRYDSLRSLAAGVASRPVVITGSPYEGVWSVPAGESFLASLLRDAGAASPWEDTPGTGSLNLDPEVAFAEGLRADVWLNPGTVKTWEELGQVLPRYAVFPAVRSKQVFNTYRLSRPGGANAYWEEAPAHPDWLLEDLIRIFQPDLLPAGELRYYQPLQP